MPTAANEIAGTSSLPQQADKEQGACQMQEIPLPNQNIPVTHQV